MRMSVKGQSVFQKRAAEVSILRLTGAWGRQPSNKQKHLLGPRCPACAGCCQHLFQFSFLAYNKFSFLAYNNLLFNSPYI